LAALIAARLPLILALWTACASAPNPEIPGFAENDPDPRNVLLEEILPDLRVHVDIDPADPPRNLRGADLPAGEVREAVRLGLGNWASVIPMMKFRLVGVPDSANLVLRFRSYGRHISGGSTAEAFLPGQWRPHPPSPGAFDFSCGAREPGRFPSGGRCRETANNIILFQSRGLAFRSVDFLDARMRHAYLAGMADRSDSAKRFFRRLPDPRFKVWPPDRSTCVSGKSVTGELPVWDPVCLDESDWAALPGFDRFGPEIGAYDLASLVQHEFGHTLLGRHTGEGGKCSVVEGADYRDDARDTVFRERSAIRKVRPASGAGPYGYSTMLPGNGLDASWNTRGVFPFDAARLASGSLDWNCAPSGPWKGYAISYPGALGWIVLGKPSGETKYVDDWGYAQRLMGWPAGGGARETEWFQTGIITNQERRKPAAIDGQERREP